MCGFKKICGSNKMGMVLKMGMVPRKVVVLHMEKVLLGWLDKKSEYLEHTDSDF
jgi:hypothetical protein